MANREQDAVGETSKPDVLEVEEDKEKDPLLVSKVSRMEKLDSIIEAEHVESKVEVANPKTNVISRDRAQYWTEVVSVPSVNEGEENLVLSRLEIEHIVMAKLEQEKKAIYEVSFKGRYVAFEVFEKLNNTEALPDEEPTCPVATVFPKGQERLKSKVERLYPGTSRLLSFRDFGNHWNFYQPRQNHGRRHGFSEDYSSPFLQIWMDDHGEVCFYSCSGSREKKNDGSVFFKVTMCPMSYTFNVSLYKKVKKVRYTLPLRIHQNVAVYSGMEIIAHGQRLKIRIANGPDQTTKEIKDRKEDVSGW
jgi:hypothetical protein